MSLLKKIYIQCFILFGILFWVNTCKASSSLHENENKLVIAIETFPDVFIPSLKSGSVVFNIGAQIFAGLTRYDQNGNIVPYLAKSWTISEDKLIYTFKLHENAYFHDGQAINADDIVFSVESSKKNHPFTPFLSLINKVTALDEKTVQIHLEKPLHLLPNLLVPIFVPILPQHIYKTEKALTEHQASSYIVGSGPFYLESYQKNSYIRLVKNTNFFMPHHPKLNEIEYKIFLNVQEVLYALLLGDIDVINFFSSVELSSFMEENKQSNGTTEQDKFNFYPVENIYPYFTIIYNFKKPLFSNRKVREAFALGINLDSLANYFNISAIRPMYTPISPLSPFSLDLKRKHNIDKANKLLDEAGYVKDIKGKRFSITIDYANDAFRLTLIRWLQNEFSTNLGIEIKTREQTSLIHAEDYVISGDFDLFLDELFSWNDPLIGLHRLYYSKNIDKNIIWTNNSTYQNPKLDTLFNLVSIEQNKEKRQNIYNEIQKIIAEEYASLWLLSNHYILAASKKIKNLGSLYYSLMSPLLDVEKTDF